MLDPAYPGGDHRLRHLVHGPGQHRVRPALGLDGAGPGRRDLLHRLPGPADTRRVPRGTVEREEVRRNHGADLGCLRGPVGPGAELHPTPYRALPPRRGRRWHLARHPGADQPLVPGAGAGPGLRVLDDEHRASGSRQLTGVTGTGAIRGNDGTRGIWTAVLNVDGTRPPQPPRCGIEAVITATLSHRGGASRRRTDASAL